MFKHDSQDDAPLCDALQKYLERHLTTFTVPGHKMGRSTDQFFRKHLDNAVFQHDIPLLKGLDDRTESHKVRERAEKLAAAAYKADVCFISVNGSSMSAHAAMMAVADPGETVIVPRNSHKSLIAACVIAGVNLVFIETEIDEELNVQHGIEPASVRRMLQKRPDAKAVFIVSPTYFGVASDIKGIAEVCHERNIPLIVDEAWGAHFPFCDQLPPAGTECGADLCIVSIHKTLSGLGQASLVLQKGKRIDSHRLKLAVTTFESTSPSSLILCSADAARRQMVQDGQKLWGRTVELANHVREELKNEKDIFIYSSDLEGRPGVFKFDKVKIVIDVSGLGVTGFAVGDRLDSNHNIMVELADEQRVAALLTIADDEDSIKKLVSGLRESFEWARRQPREQHRLPKLKEICSEEVIPPSKAWYHKTKTVSLQNAANEISAEMLSPYPPGIPRVVPGERITPELVEFFSVGQKLGMYIDAIDPTLKNIRVVDFT